VATSIGGIKDIVQPDETGLLVAAKDGASLRAGLQRLLADPEAAARMGAAAAASVHRRYTRDMVVSSYIALFDAIHPRGGSR
jgi:glycosyltransferase involved in cell wall biosynthesis